jgi:hypothetical protein
MEQIATIGLGDIAIGTQRSFCFAPVNAGF